MIKPGYETLSMYLIITNLDKRFLWHRRSGLIITLKQQPIVICIDLRE